MDTNICRRNVSSRPLRSLAAITLVGALLLSGGCASDYDARTMNDTSRWDGMSNRCYETIEAISGGIAAGLLIGLFFWGAWAGTSHNCHY